MARETWTDERLDDLKGMSGRFDRIDREIEQVVSSIRELRGDVKGMQRLMIQGFFGLCTLIVTCFGILAGMIAL